MEIIINTIKLILVIITIGTPIILLNKLHKRQLKNTFIPYLMIGTITMLSIILSIGWWSDFSTTALLSNLGYNFDAMNDAERFKNVTLEDLEKVKNLEKKMLGIGWPVKAVLFYFIYYPYLFIVYLTFYFYRKNKATKT
jgi:hypothetical protein